jgi:hypothetical protein
MATNNNNGFQSKQENKIAGLITENKILKELLDVTSQQLKEYQMFLAVLSTDADLVANKVITLDTKASILQQKLASFSSDKKPDNNAVIAVSATDAKQLNILTVSDDDELPALDSNDDELPALDSDDDELPALDSDN